jgi:hypothetical protein
VFPSGLLGGPIVLKGFVEILFIYEPSSTQEVGRGSGIQKMVMFVD